MLLTDEDKNTKDKQYLNDKYEGKKPVRVS